jgi:hypothetical protein
MSIRMLLSSIRLWRSIGVARSPFRRSTRRSRTLATDRRMPNESATAWTLLRTRRIFAQPDAGLHCLPLLGTKLYQATVRIPNDEGTGGTPLGIVVRNRCRTGIPEMLDDRSQLFFG